MADGSAAVTTPSTGPPQKKARPCTTTRQERRLISKAASDIISEVTLSETQSEHSSSNISLDGNLSTFNDHSDSGDSNIVHNNLNHSVLSTDHDSNSDSKESVDNLEGDNLLAQSNLSIEDKLKYWAKQFNIPHIATTSLLHILKPHFPSLPLDSRTLLVTPRSINVIDCSGGSFAYFGLEKNIIQKASSGLQTDRSKYPLIDKIKNDLRVENIFTITVNVDGLPIEKSGTKSFWPLLAVLDQANDKSPFIIALYEGDAKPNSSNEFLTPFVNECADLERRGIMFNNVLFSFRISCFIADAPARAFLKCTVGHNSLYGCEKCLQEGVYHGRTTWPLENNTVLRNDKDFENCVYEDHQYTQSVLTQLNIGLITQVPLDFMHQVCLGVMKKLLVVWVHKGPKSAKLSALSITNLSERLLKTTKYIPKEFSRKTRSIKYLKFWKATEFRSFILYLGPVVLNGILPDHLYRHFLVLHVAIYILCNPELCKQVSNQNYVHDLLKTFLTFVTPYYCKELMIFNFHNLLHLVKDVVNFGPLDNFSAFPFENYMKNIKKMVRGPNKALQQVAKRVGENDVNASLIVKRVEIKEGSKIYHNGEIKSVVYNNLSVSAEPPNNCFVTNNGHYVVIESIKKSKSSAESLVLYCKSFNVKNNLYSGPIESSKLNIYKVKNLGQLCQIPLSQLKTKCILLPDFSDASQFVCIPFCNSNHFY